jgi:hypothetical protein
MEDRIHLTIDDGVADVSLARPTKLNALDPHTDRLRRFNQSWSITIPGRSGAWRAPWMWHG